MHGYNESSASQDAASPANYEWCLLRLLRRLLERREHKEGSVLMAAAAAD